MFEAEDVKSFRSRLQPAVAVGQPSNVLLRDHRIVGSVNSNREDGVREGRTVGDELVHGLQG